MFNRKSALAVLVFLGWMSGPAAWALEVGIGDARINLTGPKGFCPLEKKNVTDKAMLDHLQKLLATNELLAVFARCDQLAAWRAGKVDTLGDSAQYQISLKNKGQQYSAEKTIPAICAEARKNGGAVTKNAATEINKRYDSVEATAGSLKVNEQKYYGVLHQDKTGCYNGIVQKLETDGKVATMFFVQAFVVVKGKLLFFNYSNDLEGPATVKRMLETSRSTVAATLAQN